MPFGSEVYNDHSATVEMAAAGGVAGGSSATCMDGCPHRNLRVSIIVPVYNGGAAFPRCLESLRNVDPAPAEILIVDDGSTDGSAELASQAGFRVLHTTTRSGPATARNLGAQHATGDLLFFVDADCSLAPDALAHFVPIFESDPEVDAVIGSYDDHPVATNLLSQYKNLLHHYFHQISGSTGFTFWGACGVIRRDIFQILGGFDEAYRHACIEDIELGYRLVASQGKIRVCPDLQVTHHKCWRPLNLFRADFFLRALPWSRLILAYDGRMDNSLNISRLARLRVALSGLIATFLAISLADPRALSVAACLTLMLIACDWPILRWFYRKRGLLFSLAVVPWHWFSHFYSGCAFAFALATHLLMPQTRRSPTPVARPKAATTSA